MTFGQPVRLSQEQIQRLSPFNTASELFLGGIWGSVKAGQTWLAMDGRRVIMQAGGTAVIYLLVNPQSRDNGALFLQGAAGFRGEVTTYPIIEAGRRSQAMAKLAEYEMQFLMGVASCVSGIGLVAVLGADAVKFVVDNRHNFPKWSKAISVCLTGRRVLKTYAPTLYDKLIDGALLGLWEGAKLAVGVGGPGVAANLPEAALKDPKIAGRGTGVIVGKIGKSALAGRMSALSVVWTILWTVATKAAGAVPGAVHITIDERKDAATQIVERLRGVGVTLSTVDAEKIVNEVRAHPREVRQVLQELKDAFAEAKGG